MGARPDDFERHTADKAGEMRLDRVALGEVVAREVSRTGSPHKMIPDRGFDMLVNNLGLAEHVPEEDVEKAAAYGDVRGRRVPPTRREQEVAQALADGQTTLEAAAAFGSSRFTVGGHLSRLIYNLGADTREHAIAMMTAAGLVTPQRRPRRIRVKRQRQIVSMIIDGLTTEEIADDLGLAPNTVRGHLAKLVQAVGARTREEAVAMLVAAGVARPERRMPEYPDRGNRARSVAKPRLSPREREARAKPRRSLVDREIRASGRPGRPSIPEGRLADVLAKLATGLSNSEIAAALHLTEDQVKDAVKRLLAQTGTRNRVELAVLAVKEDLTV